MTTSTHVDSKNARFCAPCWTGAPRRAEEGLR